MTSRSSGLRLGLITPLTGNFCSGCNRVRVTATGTVYGCLGQDQKIELRDLMRAGQPLDDALDALMRGKPEGHDFHIAAPPPGGRQAYERHRRLMDTGMLLAIAALMAVAAALYSSVGHGGASAYLAIMALVLGGAGDDAADRAGAEPRRRRASARRATGCAGRPTGSCCSPSRSPPRPAAWLGGGIHLPPEYYRPLVGALLIAAAVRLFWSPKQLA